MMGPEDLPIDCKLYLKPEGLVPSGLSPLGGGRGTMRHLAGGWMAFTALRIIARHEGQRVLDHIVAAVEFENYARRFLTPHRNQLLALLNHLTEQRVPLKYGALHLGWDRPHVMAIMNMTPDSFSDGGKFDHIDTATDAARHMHGQGASLVDVGGESTRPGAKAVSAEVEWQRVAPLLDILVKNVIPVSIDSRKSAVMAQALDAGAVMINDVNALQDEGALALAAKAGVPVVIMHAQGDPRTMQESPHYDDVMLDIYDFLDQRIKAAVAAGIDRARIILDVGIGFGKSLGHNAALFEGLSLFHALGCPLLLGASRKRFIAAMSKDEKVDDRLGGSIAAVVMGLQQGVQMFRVHDVQETVQAINVFQCVVKSGNITNQGDGHEP